VSLEIRQLVDACIANDPSAMGRLVHRFQGRVFGLCYRMLGQWQDAEDAAQDTFLRVSRSLRRWDCQREFEPWLLTIAANRCRTLLAQRSRQAAVRQLALEQVSNDDSARATVTPVAEASGAFLEEIEHALGGMPKQWARAFRLFHERQLSYQQIAIELGCPLGTVKTWVHRGRRELVQRLRRRNVGPD